MAREGQSRICVLVLLALKFVHSTTLPLVQSDLFCRPQSVMLQQDLTLFIVVHTHASPCLFFLLPM